MRQRGTTEDNAFYRTISGTFLRRSFGTLAEILGLGAGQVDVGDVAWDQTNERWVTARTVGPTTFGFIAGQFPSYPCNTAGTNALRYMSWIGGNLLAAISYNARGLRYKAGELRAVAHRPSLDPGAVIMGSHLNENGTPLETQAYTGAAGVMSVTEFSSTSFGAGDRLSISCDPANDPGINLWVVACVFNMDASDTSVP